MTDLDLPEGLETLREDGFHGCSALKRVGLGEGVLAEITELKLKRKLK